MCLHLGNYVQEMITTFTDTDEKTYTFQEYLKSRGLFASRFHVYLMSTFVRDGAEGSANGADGKTQISGDFEHLMATSTQKTSAQLKKTKASS